MAYCPDCGIEVSTQRADCPLCGAKLQADRPGNAPPFPTTVQRARPDPYGWVEIRRILFATLSILPTLGIISVIVVNLVQNGTLNWARYAVVSLVAGWAVLAFSLYKYHKPLALMWRITGVLSVFLVLLDLFGGGFSWSLRLAVPILLGLAGLSHWVWWSTAQRRVHWALGTAIILAALMAFCLLLELLLALYFGYSLLPSWSGIVCLCLGPPAVFLLYVRYRLAKKVDFAKLFHR